MCKGVLISALIRKELRKIRGHWKNSFGIRKERQGLAKEVTLIEKWHLLEDLVCVSISATLLALNDCNWTRPQNHLVRKQTLNQANTQRTNTQPLSS